MPLFFCLLAGEWLNLLIVRGFTAQHVNSLAWLTVYLSLAGDTVSADTVINHRYQGIT